MTYPVYKKAETGYEEMLKPIKFVEKRVSLFREFTVRITKEEALHRASSM